MAHDCNSSRWRRGGSSWYCGKCGQLQCPIYPNKYLLRTSERVDFDGPYGAVVYPNDSVREILEFYSLTDARAIRDYWDAYDRAQRADRYNQWLGLRP